MCRYTWWLSSRAEELTAKPNNVSWCLAVRLPRNHHLPDIFTLSNIAEPQLDTRKPNYKVDLKASRGHRLSLSVDMLMLVLLVINLAWIVFDAMFATQLAPNLLKHIAPVEWVDYYAEAVHPNFLVIDLGFIALFTVELLIRWVVAIARKEYRHWASYPVVHWYDVLGLIPLPAFRWFRLLRVVSVFMRLHRMGVVDYRNWAIVNWLFSAYGVVVEEVSDRVVVRVIDGIQAEVATAQELETKIAERVIAPRQEELIQAIATRVSDTVQISYREHQDQISTYVKRLVSQAVHDNPEIKLIDKVPLMGGAVSGTLDHAITDIVNRVIEGAIEGTSEPEFQSLFANLGETGMQALMTTDDETTSRILAEATVDLLEVIKDEVRVQRWRG